MGEITADVMERARQIGRQWFGVGHHDSEILAQDIAEAIMEERAAERERCAKIVGGIGGVLTNNGVPFAGELLNTIADAISEQP
jgi:hypothetical protein